MTWWCQFTEYIDISFRKNVDGHLISILHSFWFWFRYSLAPGWRGSKFKNVIAWHMLRIKLMSISCEIALLWMAHNLLTLGHNVLMDFYKLNRIRVGNVSENSDSRQENISSNTYNTHGGFCIQCTSFVKLWIITKPNPGKHFCLGLHHTTVHVPEITSQFTAWANCPSPKLCYWSTNSPIRRIFLNR